jgi:hypothetical protein
MTQSSREDFVRRHLIVDASTYTRRNLTSTDTAFALFEALTRNLDMTAVLPPIVCRYPFASDDRRLLRGRGLPVPAFSAGRVESR